MVFNQSSISPPSSENSQDIANKLQGKTIVLDPKFWVGKDIKNYKEQLDNAIVSQNILTKEEVQYVSWGDVTFNQARSYPNCDFTVSKDGETAVAHNIDLDVEDVNKETFNEINNLIEHDIMGAEEGSLEYIGAVPPYGSIDTSDPSVMQKLVNSIGQDPAIMFNKPWNIPNFNKKYSKYISFDKMKIKQNQTVTMHLKVGNYTKDYQIIVWWRTTS